MKNTNWPAKEMKLFCKILVDPVNNLKITLEKKAVKKASIREVFKQISGWSIP